MAKKAKSVVVYSVLTNALMNAALSRRAALQVELAVGMIHFDQEDDGTEAAGKARLKEVYNNAGYQCMTKKDPDYITVNRRLNACAGLYDKFGSSLVSGWVQNGMAKAQEQAQEGAQATQTLMAHMLEELAAYNLYTMDDVLHYVGKDSSKSRAPRQPSGPVTIVTPEPAQAQEQAQADNVATLAAPAGRLDLNIIKAQMLAQFAPEVINQFCAELLEQVALAEAALKQAA